MSPKERRAFVRGYRLALRKARCELAEMTKRLDEELAGLDDRMRAAREQTVRDIGDGLVGLMVEMEGMKNEFRRWRAIEEAVAVERDPNEPLH